MAHLLSEVKKELGVISTDCRFNQYTMFFVSKKNHYIYKQYTRPTFSRYLVIFYTSMLCNLFFFNYYCIRCDDLKYYNSLCIH